MTTQDTIICQRAIHSARRVDIPLTKKARRAGFNPCYSKLVIHSYIVTQAIIDQNLTQESSLPDLFPELNGRLETPTE